MQSLRTALDVLLYDYTTITDFNLNDIMFVYLIQK